jgi:hypothetical protein
VAAQSKAWVCGRSLAGIVGSNPAGVMEVFFLSVLYVVRQRSLRRANHSSRIVLPCLVCSIRVNAKPYTGSPCTGIGSNRHRKLNLNTTEIMCKSAVERRVTMTGRLRGFDASVTLGLIMFEFYLL